MATRRNPLVAAATAYTATLAEEETDTSTEVSTWSGVIVVEGEPTGDGRLIEDGALTWETSPENPLLMRYVQQDVGAHDGAEVVGRIFEITRRDNGEIFARGDFDLGSEVGREAHRQVKEKLTRGVSVDLDDVSFEVRVASELLDDSLLTEPVEDEDEEEDTGEHSGITQEEDEEGRVVVAKVEKDAELFVTTEARIRAATLVATPAFAEAYISLDDTDTSEETDDSDEPEPSEDDTLTAAAAPLHPPESWFSDPKLHGPTALTVDDDGRVYGHLATWDTCHVGDPSGNGSCVTAPHSMTDYAYFHTGSVRTKEGSDIAVGHITMGTGHAKPQLKHAAVAHHYDNTGTAVADIRAGEDAFGIWVAGALRPDVTPAQVRTLRASPLSGDWRGVGGNLEMLAALAVNVPGFPVPRPKGLVASGKTMSLTAAGMLAPRKVRRTNDHGDTLSAGDLKYLKRLAQRGRETEKADMTHKVSKARAQMNRRKIEKFRTKRGV